MTTVIKFTGYIIAVAALALTGAADAAEQRQGLPQKFWGQWCRDDSNVGELHREFSEKIITFIKDTPELICTDHATLVQTSYRRDAYEYSCDVMSVKVVMHRPERGERPRTAYRVTQECGYEGDLIRDVDIIWIENKALKIQPISTKTISRG
jgi:hypothetical protein